MEKFGTAIILAGGKSTRMGFDKQKIHIGNRSMVQYIANQLVNLFDEIIIVTNTPDYYNEVDWHKNGNDYKDIKVTSLIQMDKDRQCNYTIIGDIYKEKGPLGGLHVGLLHSKSEWTFVTACDMPIVNLEYIEMMEELIVADDLDSNAVFGCVTQVKGMIEPFNAFYASSQHKKVEDGIVQGHLKFSRFILEQQSKIIQDVDALKYSKDFSMFMNLNTLIHLKKNELLNGRINLPA